MVKLNAKYMGLDLPSPLIVSACPLSEKLDNIKLMEDSGAGAVVLFSIFEEQFKKVGSRIQNEIIHKNRSGISSSNSFPHMEQYRVSLGDYLELIQKAKAAVDIPIIGSLNGISEEGWIEHSLEIEEAGADALELNVYFVPANIEESGRQVEERYYNILKIIKGHLAIPVAMKLNPYFSSIGNMALNLSRIGADGVVLFNRFYEPDFDIENMKLRHSLSLSEKEEIRLPLLWLAILYGKIDASLAATTGVQKGEELIKYLLAGADVVQTASALLKHGIPYIGSMVAELENWMANMGFKNLQNIRGLMSQKRSKDPTAFERANYVRVLEGNK